MPEGKAVKNQLHLHLAPLASDDQEAEVRRLEGLGATRADVGQHDEQGHTNPAHANSGRRLIIEAAVRV